MNHRSTGQSSQLGSEYWQAEAAANVIAKTFADSPDVAIVLGSGFGELANIGSNSKDLSYQDIPYFAPPSVLGHAGMLTFTQVNHRKVLFLKGRYHFYEGYTPRQTVFPIMVIKALGVKTLLLTNAAGGLNPSFSPGDLMLISDHINLLALIGKSPLRGPHDSKLGPRFLPQTTLYSSRLQKCAQESAIKHKIDLKRGVYIGVAGPSYETPAEARCLRLLGADACGMSTTNEAMMAHSLGIEVGAFSGITNIAAELELQRPVKSMNDGSIMTPGSVESIESHDQVLLTGEKIARQLSLLLLDIIQ